MGSFEDWCHSASTTERGGTMLNTPPSMERLLVPTKCWARKIGISTTPDLREQRDNPGKAPLQFSPVPDHQVDMRRPESPSLHPRQESPALHSRQESPALHPRQRASTCNTIIGETHSLSP